MEYVSIYMRQIETILHTLELKFDIIIQVQDLVSNISS